LQENGYDVFIHDRVGRHRIKLDISNQICNLLIQKTPKEDRCFLWDDLTLYRLDPQSYYPQTMYSMNSDDTKLFVKKSGNKVYLGEAGWRRTASRQFMYTSRLVTIDLDSGKHKVTDADFIDANPLFINSADSNQRSILSEIRAFKNDRINTIDLQNGSLNKIIMHTKDAIASIKKKYPDLSDPKPGQFRPIGRTELLIGLESKKTNDVSIFKLDDKGVISPWQTENAKRLELIQEYVYRETRSDSSPFEAVIIRWDYKNQVHRLCFNEFKSEKERFIRFIRSEENMDVYLFFDDWSRSFENIHDNTRKDIGRLPSTYDIGYKYFKSAEWNTIKLNVFTSGFGAVAKYSRKYSDPDDSKVSFFRPFMPWIKNYIVKVFAFPDLKEIDFGKL